MKDQSFIAYLMIGAYALVTLIISLYGFRREENTPEDYFLAGRRMPWLIVAMSMFVSLASAVSYMGIPGTAYKENIALLVVGLVLYFARLEQEAMESQSAFLANVLLFGVIILFLAAAIRRRVPVYEVFVEGAKDGFKVAVMIIPSASARSMGATRRERSRHTSV